MHPRRNGSEAERAIPSAAAKELQAAHCTPRRGQASGCSSSTCGRPFRPHRPGLEVFYGDEPEQTNYLAITSQLPYKVTRRSKLCVAPLLESRPTGEPAAPRAAITAPVSGAAKLAGSVTLTSPNPVTGRVLGLSAGGAGLPPHKGWVLPTPPSILEEERAE